MSDDFPLGVVYLEILYKVCNVEYKTSRIKEFSFHQSNHFFM